MTGGEPGWLLVVGTGCEPDGPLSRAAYAEISRADKVFFYLEDPAVISWVTVHGAGAEPLQTFRTADTGWAAHIDRMCHTTLAWVRYGIGVAVVVDSRKGGRVLAARLVGLADAEELRAAIIPAVDPEVWSRAADEL